MKNYIITENQEQIIINNLLNENVGDYCEKRLAIKKFLDDNFQKGQIDQSVDGNPQKMDIVIRITTDKKPFKVADDKYVFYKVQQNFRNILPQEELDDFIKKVIVAWYYNKITKNGTIIP